MFVPVFFLLRHTAEIQVVPVSSSASLHVIKINTINSVKIISSKGKSRFSKLKATAFPSRLPLPLHVYVVRFSRRTDDMVKPTGHRVVFYEQLKVKH